MKLLSVCFSLFILSSFIQPASAGPLRDRIKERIAERQQANDGNDVEEADLQIMRGVGSSYVAYS